MKSSGLTKQSSKSKTSTVLCELLAGISIPLHKCMNTEIV